jgi:ABC-type dipeptide/oligopeptide/nickel transport system permease component
MFTYVLSRLGVAVPTFFAVIFITFALTYLSPFDPVTIIIQQNEASLGNLDREALAERIRTQYGLDQPFLVQFGQYVGGFLRGDLGSSISGQRDVLRTITTTFPVSFQLGLAGAVLTALVGIPLGALAAIRQNTWMDYGIVGSTLVFRSLPVFVLVLGIMKVPRGWDGLFHSKAILPVFILMLGPLPVVVRQTRQAVLEIFAQDYVRTAKAKGLQLHWILARHILRNALIPVVTTLGFVTEGLIVGAIFLDKIFGIPGFGGVVEDAFRSFDYPVIMGVTMVTSLMIILTNLVVDLIYPFLDPRIRLE